MGEVTQEEEYRVRKEPNVKFPSTLRFKEKNSLAKEKKKELERRRKIRAVKCMAAKGKSVSRAWPTVLSAAKRSCRFRTFYLKMPVRFGDESLW